MEYYTNYTFISPQGIEYDLFYFYPHYEVGTVNFKMRFSKSLSCKFYIYDGDTLIEEFGNFYTLEIEHVLKIPASTPKPTLLKIKVTNYNYRYPYYIYLYNNNYVVPLNFSNYYFYQLSINNLEINYDIDNLSKDIYIKFQTIIEFPELNDNLHIKLNDGEIEHIFNEKSSYYDIQFKQNNKYKLNLKCNLNNKFTNKTLMLIYFEENEKDYKNLFYQNDINISYKSIFDNNKIYFIDNINLIDGYNLYNFSLNEFSSKTILDNLQINIYIKKYSTYDINYIKNNTPSSKSDYNEFFNMEKNNSFIIKTCEDHSQQDKTILIYVEINYQYNINPLYEYSIKKITENKKIEFKPYLLNWYTKYDFSPTQVDYKDIIFISTNHSNTIFPITTNNARTFTSFYKGHLYVAYEQIKTEANNIMIKYSDEKAEKMDENDMGYFEVLKLNHENKNSFEVIDINNDLENKVFNLELKRNYDKYFYIKINANDNNEYYLYNEMRDKNSFLTIEEMPINIIEFIQNEINSEINLINNNNEYIFKIGYLKPVYNLVRTYLIKNENKNELYISEGQIKMYTFSKNESRINLDINLLSENLTNNNYINIKIPSNKIEQNLYIEYNNEQSEIRYALNNSGINLYYINDYTINIDIINEGYIDEDIPIMIKYPLNINNLKLINESDKYTFNPGEIGLYNFDNNKNIKMELISEKNNFEIFYYIDYINEENFNNGDNLLLSPEIFNKKEFASNKIKFEINTELDIEKINSENNNLTLYLIFSFDSKVTISNSDSNGGINMIIIGIIIGVSVVIVAIIAGIYIFLYKKKKKKILITPLNESGNNEINYNSQATSGNYEENNLYNKPEVYDYPNMNEIITNDRNKENNCLITESSDISMENNANLPAPLPK